ncbi:MAG: alpha-mannosidase [Ilumatobacteraceae bacterium]
MHDESALLERRLRRELLERLMPAMYRATVPLRVTAWEVPGEPVEYSTASSSLARDGVEFAVGSHYGRPWGTTWFRLEGEVPASWPDAAGGGIELVVDLGFHPDSAGFQSEGLAWHDGVPLQGIHPRRTAVPLPVGSTRRVELLVEAASNPAFPMRATPSPFGSLRTAGDRPLYRLRQADLGWRDDDVFHLLLDIEVLLELMASLDATSPRRQRLLRELTAAFDAIDMSSPAEISTTAPRARALLVPALSRRNGDSAHRVVAVGHAHIDSAWLWPVRETVRKCARTFASAVRMIDQYPEFRFVCSQAVQYHWMATRYPDLFDRIRERVAAGGWQPVGGMWVEADMNLPSGESIVRQMVHGQRWFEEHLGSRCSEVWIPDVFGYPASLPQIFRSGGAARFVTQKLSWNKQNRFPHHTFWWVGLDGSRVLTHFPPVDTYNATITGSELVHSERNFREHGWSDWSLMPFGHGNGGGGTTREMIERARRSADLEGLPRVSMGTTGDFFDRVEAEAAAGAPVPVWDGELYFEMHRGTLTSQVQTKAGNRRCERLLREAELWWATAAHAGAVDAGDERTAAAEMDGLWKDVLLQQFHDILPGSSITWVHDDAAREHARIAERLEALVAEPLRHLVAGSGVANASAHERREVIALPVNAGVDVSSCAQVLHDGSRAVMVEVGSLSVRPVASAVVEPSAVDDRVTMTEHSLANSSVAVHWSLDGTITSIIDVRAGRELLPADRGIGLWLAPDQPVEYDAWDLESWTRRLGRPVAREWGLAVGPTGPVESVGAVVAVEVIDAGPLVGTVRIVRSFGSSTVEQRVTLRAGSARVDLAFDIDWHEDEQLLTLDIPLDVRAREAACGIHFGHVMRPMHASTSWDAAKFEVCAHRWVDVAERDWGVAVLDEGRYGHGLLDGGVTVSLARAAKYPDPVQDHGRHAVTVAVLPHGAGLAEVVREADALNVPMRHVDGLAGATGSPVVDIRHAAEHALDVSAVKCADDGSGDVVVRMAEVCGARTPVTVVLGRRVTAASRCNALEEPEQGLDVADGIVDVVLRPFELVTLRLSGTT